MFLHSLSSFLCKHCICGHKCDYSIVDMPSLRSARYICLAANSICFRYAQARYDIDPRSRSEHIECVSTYRTRQRISKIRASGSISTRCALKGTALTIRRFLFYLKISPTRSIWADPYRKNSFRIRSSRCRHSRAWREDRASAR